jgi:hypothetical protein
VTGVRGAAGLAAAAGVLLAVGLSAAPGWRTPLIAAYVLLVGILAVELLVRLLGTLLPSRAPSALEAALRRPAQARHVPERVEALARLLTLASASARHAHTRLRPVLRSVAADRLAWSRECDLGREPTAARRILGEPAWALVAEAGEPPADRAARGPDAATLAAVVTALERAGEP